MGEESFYNPKLYKPPPEQEMSEEERILKSQWKEIEVLEEMSAFEIVSTRMVDNVDKSRLVAREIAKYKTNVPEDEDILVSPPTVWLKREAEQGRSTRVLWKMCRVLYGRRNAANGRTDVS
jgi:hypothetical protein